MTTVSSGTSGGTPARYGAAPAPASHKKNPRGQERPGVLGRAKWPSHLGRGLSSRGGLRLGGHRRTLGRARHRSVTAASLERSRPGRCHPGNPSVLATSPAPVHLSGDHQPGSGRRDGIHPLYPLRRRRHEAAERGISGSLIPSHPSRAPRWPLRLCEADAIHAGVSDVFTPRHPAHRHPQRLFRGALVTADGRRRSAQTGPATRAIRASVAIRRTTAWGSACRAPRGSRRARVRRRGCGTTSCSPG